MVVCTGFAVCELFFQLILVAGAAGYKVTTIRRAIMDENIDKKKDNQDGQHVDVQADMPHDRIEVRSKRELFMLRQH